MTDRNETVSLPPNYRVMKGVVIILGMLILLCLGALAAGLLLGGGPREAAIGPYDVKLDLGRGGRIVDAQAVGNRLSLRVENNEGGEIVVVDPATGRVTGRISAGR